MPANELDLERPLGSNPVSWGEPGIGFCPRVQNSRIGLSRSATMMSKRPVTAEANLRSEDRRSGRCAAPAAAPTCDPRPLRRAGCSRRHPPPGSRRASGSRSLLRTPQFPANTRMSPAPAVPPCRRAARSRCPGSRSAASDAVPRPIRLPRSSKCTLRPQASDGARLDDSATVWRIVSPEPGRADGFHCL